MRKSGVSISLMSVVVVSASMVAGVLFPSSAAGQRWGASVGDLEKGLHGIDASITALVDQNTIIEKENQQLQKEIEIAQKQAMLFEEYQSGGMPEAAQEDPRDLGGDSPLQKEQMTLQDEITVNKAAQRQLVSEIANVESDIAQLQAAVVAADPVQEEKKFLLEKKQLLDALTEKAQLVKDLERRLLQIKGQYAQPLENAGQLRVQRQQLLDDTAAVEKDLQAQEEMRKRLRDEIEDIQTQNEEYVARLTATIADLEKRKIFLDGALAKIEQKLGAPDQWELNDKQRQALRENVGMMKKENTMLKEEVAKIREKKNGQ